MPKQKQNDYFDEPRNNFGGQRQPGTYTSGNNVHRGARRNGTIVDRGGPAMGPAPGERSGVAPMSEPHKKTY